MKLKHPLLFILIISCIGQALSDDRLLERGTKGEIEDVILIGADDWHTAIAATPLAIWSEENETVRIPLLVLPQEVEAGERNGWVEQSDLERYGAPVILSAFKSANISAITIHGSGENVKDLTELAHKDGLKVYITAGLEVPLSAEKAAVEGLSKLPEAIDAMLVEADLDLPLSNNPGIDRSLLQVANPDIGGNATLYCPVNQGAKDNLYNYIETLIDDYKADGVVLYNFGFQDENYCYCNFCKEKFYQDTGIDLSKVYSNSYNLERWRQWKQDQVMEIANYARNITTDLGPVKLGAALDNPFDRVQGYNFARISQATDFMVISPLSAQEVGEVCLLSEKPVYVRLSDDYLAYILSTQNVEGAVRYMEDLNRLGAAGLAFEFDVVHTPVWAELEPPSPATNWLLGQIGGESLAIGNVSWKYDRKLEANNSYDLAEKISRLWKSAPGAVIVGENYSAALTAAPIASYLNWPVLYVGEQMPSETGAALQRLGVRNAVLAGPISAQVKENLSRMNITWQDASERMLIEEMRLRGESPDMVVYANSRDLSLLLPQSSPSVKRTFVEDLLVRMELSPSQVPAEEIGQIVRLNITLSNTGKERLPGVRLLDSFPMGRLIKWPRADTGQVNITDPYSGQPSDAVNSFLNGSLLRCSINRLEPGQSSSLNVDVELLYPMDSGWEEGLDRGATVAYDGYFYNHTLRNLDDPPAINLTYPFWIYSGRTNISWSLDREAAYTAINLYSPDRGSGRLEITDIEPDKLYDVQVQMLTPGRWTFNIEAGDGALSRTKNYTVEVLSNTPALNVTAFSHTKVPRLSLLAPAAAAARRAVLLDVARDPQQIDPSDEEEALNQKVEDLEISPRYLMVVGDPGSMPFISTGLTQKVDEVMEYEIFRDYQLLMDDGNYSKVAVGRIMALSVYDASQLLARTLAYDQLNGSWKESALVISSPPLSFPQSPIAISIRDYLRDAGLEVRDLRYEEATYQQAVSQMNNGQNIVTFNNHGSEDQWGLSDWSMMDSTLTVGHVKDLVLSPQTTTTDACVTANLKGYYINVTGTRMYVPLKLEDSIALSFIRAGAVSYIGESSLSWIFLSEDFIKRFYQSLVYENATVGEAVLDADNLYRLKFQGAENIKEISDYDEPLPEWDESVSEMLNQTAYMDMMLGDPSFRPYLPRSPALPYRIKTLPSNATIDNASSVETSITPENDSATDWLYWVETDSSGGALNLNAPPAIIGEALLPKDADKVVVKEDGLTVWHGEYVIGDKKKVMWPVIRPRLGEERRFSIEYMIVPGQVQRINITAGWNAVSIYLQPNDPKASKYLSNKPYRSIFTIAGPGWDFNMKDGGLVNVTSFYPGEGLLIDSSENFTLEIAGKPVDLPYRLDLHPGWNMVGLPVNQTVALENITVSVKHKRYGYPEAVDEGMVSAFVWKYDPSGWTHLGENETLMPGMAYLFEAMDDARLEFR
ncbi:MAG: C25 family cysteine peptidase [Methanothrix sp.]|nr:C25 family cysteine peptidase [Methanothrix sp.]MDD1760190.1 C25 family cysteine peptidase [Methanothrix sp.]